jgi:homocysteine S-methyltransferase
MPRPADLLDSAAPLLAEGAVIERLRRDPACSLDPHVAHAAFHRSPDTARVLESIFREYLEIAQDAGLFILCFSPTWRANPEHLRQAGLSEDINREGVAFLRRILADYPSAVLGGLMGCRGDAYRPEEALAEANAARFHAAQAQALAGAGCDFLCAATMPAASEAAGIATAMSRTGVPYLVSFLVTADGTLLDGIPITDAVARIDASVTPAPLGYLVNCVHPTIMASALERCDARDRILGLQANTSRRSPAELEGSEVLESEDPEQFAEAMIELRHRFGLRILGGCCGTDARHIRALASRLVTA